MSDPKGFYVSLGKDDTLEDAEAIVAFLQDAMVIRDYDPEAFVMLAEGTREAAITIEGNHDCMEA